VSIFLRPDHIILNDRWKVTSSFLLTPNNNPKKIPQYANRDTIIGFLKKITELGVALLALTVVLQVVFGSPVPFIGVDVIGNLTGIISTLGSSGLVGLIAAAVLYSVLKRN
tara:strand:+ start:201 stop:533 length:333 start_codon:yes stop_codon:yes gene_type:complete